MKLLTPADRAEWLTAWNRAGREPFAHPDYVALFAEDGEAGALCGHGGLLPLVLRPLPDEAGWRDATSPYGYGGPYGDPDGGFYPAVLEWMWRERVLTLFVRAALERQPPELDLPGYARVQLRDNVVVDVTRPLEEQWRHFDHKVRKNVKKAERAGLRVEIHDHFDNLDTFLDIYHSTMQRRSASDWYFFERPFFQTFADSLKGSYIVAEVYNNANEMVSTELILKSDRFLYSYLGGTSREAFIHAPNDLLKHAVIDYAQAHAKEGYVLGGGYEPDDGIFRYKKAFDVDGVVPFFGIRLTADPEVYRNMSEQRLATARTQTPDVELLAHFFPAYRAPLTSGVASSNK